MRMRFNTGRAALAAAGLAVAGLAGVGLTGGAAAQDRPEPAEDMATMMARVNLLPDTPGDGPYPSIIEQSWAALSCASSRRATRTGSA